MALVWARRRVRRPAWYCLAVALLGLLPLFVAAADEELPAELTGKVVGVHDGDMITLPVGKQPYKVPLEGIDAPEIGQDFGTQSKKELSSAIFGKSIRVETKGRDKYGRVPGNVYLGTFDINRGLILHGWAWRYSEYSDSETLANAELTARQAKSELWAGKDPKPPWEWRKMKRSQAASANAKTASKENRAARPPP